MRVTVHRDEDGRTKRSGQEIENAAGDGTRKVKPTHT